MCDGYFFHLASEFCPLLLTICQRKCSGRFCAQRNGRNGPGALSGNRQPNAVVCSLCLNRNGGLCRMYSRLSSMPPAPTCINRRLGPTTSACGCLDYDDDRYVRRSAATGGYFLIYNVVLRSILLVTPLIGRCKFCSVLPVAARRGSTAVWVIITGVRARAQPKCRRQLPKWLSHNWVWFTRVEVHPFGVFARCYVMSALGN